MQQQTFIDSILRIVDKYRANCQPIPCRTPEPDRYGHCVHCGRAVYNVGVHIDIYRHLGGSQ